MERERSVTRNAALVGALTGVSRVLGLVREVLTARMFGISALQSAFVIAFTIPNLFRRLFGEGALSAAFIPAFTQTRTREGHDAALQMARRVLTSAGLLLSLIVATGTALTFVAEPHLEAGGKAALILPLLRIMLPYAVFICLAALSMGMLNVLGDFRTPAFTPALLNVVWIAVLLGVCPFLSENLETRITAVAIGITLAGLLQFGTLWDALRRRGWTILPERGGSADPQVRRVWRQALPAALGAGAVQINVCLDFLLAYWAAAEWAPSALTYADRILYLPMGVVATAFGTVLLPTFSRQFAGGDFDAMRQTLRSALTDLTLVMAPAAVGLVALAGPIVSVLYERGQFDSLGTLRTARALAFYAPGLLVFSVHKVLNPLFYGMGDTRTPMRTAAAGVLLNLLLNILFVLTWPAEWKHAGIALSTVISSAVISIVLAGFARRRIGAIGWRGIFKTALRALAASAIMGLAARWIWRTSLAALAETARLPTGGSRVLALGITVGCAIAIYATVLFLLGPSEARRLAVALRSLRRRSPRFRAPATRPPPPAD